MPINISNIKLHIENILSVLVTIRHLCQQTDALDNSECYNMLNPLTTRYHDINKQYSSISHLLNDKIKRGAWIGGMGTIFKQIFGTLDQDDAVKYDDAINTIQNNNKELASLVKQNILVTSSVISSYNYSLHKLKTNEDNLLNAIDKLSLSMKNVSVNLNKLILTSEINSILSNLETSILDLSFQLEDLINAILFCNVNTLHPSIITPRQLFHELVDSYRHLPNDMEIAVSLDLSSIYSIINMSKLICYYHNFKVVFVLQIPLVAPQEFYLYHSIPLPVPHDSDKPDSFTMIIPENKYTAITKDKLQYIRIDSLDGCKNYNIQSFICNIVNVFSVNANPSCESEILSKVITKLPVQCKTKFLNGDLDIWKPLTNNRWLFVQSLPTKLSIDCLNSELVEETIKSVGIVTLTKYCTAYCKNTKLYANNNVLNISSPLTSFSNFNLINDTCCNLNKYKETVDNNVPPINLQNTDSENFNFNYNKIMNSIINDLDKLKNEPHIIKYGAHYSIITVLIVLAIVCFIIFKLYTKLYKSGSSPTISNSPLAITSNSPIEEDEEDRHTDNTVSNTYPSAKLRTRL